jgi:hypothetical protein
MPPFREVAMPSKLPRTRRGLTPAGERRNTKDGEHERGGQARKPLAPQRPPHRRFVGGVCHLLAATLRLSSEQPGR